MDYALSKITNIIEMGTGSRVEIDLIDILEEDEGILVGDTARGFFLVLAETRETETYPPRPFRINAGSVHQYICVENNKTKYLSELKSGDKVLVANGKNERYVTIGRVKIEKRDFIHIEGDLNITATLQKADSVHIAGKNGALHLIEAKVGDEIVVVPKKDIARHKGEAVDEDIQEK